MSDYKLVPVARAIWEIRREWEDRCDMELEDLSPDHSVWGEAKAALQAILDAAPAVQGGPVGWQFYQDGKWWNGDDRIKDHRKNTEEAGFRVRDVYAAPQPAPDVAGLVEALECILPTLKINNHRNCTYLAEKALAAYRKGGES